MQAGHAVHVSEAWWTEACKKVKNAVVFIDSYTAECLHWNGGLTRLVNAGAKNVKEFSSFECGHKEDVKAVFMVSSAIRDTTSTILQDIVQASSFQYCVVITCAHPIVHSYARHGGREADESHVMGKLEEEVLTWMGNENYTIEILYIPLFLVPYSENLLMMPSFSKLYPLLTSDVPRISNLQQSLAKGDKIKPVENLGEVEFHHLPLEMRILVRQFVTCIHSLLKGMDAWDEIYTVGHTSRIIGTELDAFNPARQRRKTASSKVSIVLVDRTLDLVEASSHKGESLMGRILSILPRLYGHQVDSAVNMAPLCEVHPSSEWTLVPGCLAPQGKEDRASAVLNTLIMSSPKKALSLINKHVLEAANQRDLGDETDETEVKVTPENLKKNIQRFASDIDAFTENAGLLQQGLGVVEALSHPSYVLLDQLLSLEKNFMQAIGDPEEISPFKQVFQLLKTRGIHGVSLDDILSLMVYVASLGGPEVFTQKDEYALTNLLSHAIVEDKKTLSDTLHELVGEEIDEVSALRTAQSVAGQLHAISSTRDHLKNYRHLHIPGDSAQPSSYQNLLQKLVYDCLTAPQAEITDLEYKSSGLKDLIKSGFSLFVNVSKPMPRDAPMMLVFVIGGVTPGEVREMRETVTAVSPPCEVIVASSHFAHPSDTVVKALQPNYFLRDL